MGSNRYKDLNYPKHYGTETFSFTLLQIAKNIYKLIFRVTFLLSNK